MRGEKLFYRIIPKDYTPPNHNSNGTEIGSFSGEKWNFLSIAHTRSIDNSKLYVIINEKEKEFVVDYPNYLKDTFFKELVLMENMQGFVTSMILYDIAVGNTSLAKLRSAYLNGLCDKGYTDSFLQSPSNHVFLLTSPCFCDAKGTILYNLIDFSGQKMTLEIIGFAGVIAGDRNYVDSLQNIIPYFNFCCLLGETKGRKMLNLTLKLSLQYLKNLSKIYNEHIRFKKEIGKFFHVLTYLFSKLVPSLPNDKTLKLLSDIPIQFPNLQTQFIKFMLGSLCLWVNIDPKLQAIFWEILKANYACDPKKYSFFININSIIRVMGNMDMSIEKGKCCRKHKATEEEKVFLNMEIQYEPIKSLMKFIMVNNTASLRNYFCIILDRLERHPSPCMFNMLVLLIRDVIENNPRNARIFEQIRGFHKIFKLSINYPVDIKIMSLSLGASAFNHLFSDPNFVVREFFKPIIPLVQQDYQMANPARASNPKKSGITQKSLSEKKLIKIDISPKRKISSDLQKTQIQESKMLNLANTTIQKKRSMSNPNRLEKMLNSSLMDIRTSEAVSNRRFQNRPRIYSELPENSFETSSILLSDHSPNRITIYNNDRIDDQTVWLYLSLIQWLTGGKIEKVLFNMKKEEHPQFASCFGLQIFQSEVASLLIALIKKRKNKNLLEVFVTNLKEIATSSKKSAMQIVSCKKLMNFIDSFLQSRPEQIEEGSTLWKLQNQLLCQSSLDLKILTLVVQNFFFQANQLAQVHPGAYRNIKEDDIKISILTKKWVEMAQYFSFDIEKDSTTDAGDYGLNGIQLIEGILQLVLLLTCSKGKKILIRKTANPFSSTEISNEYKLLQAAESIGTALTTSIEKMAEIVINTFNYREAGTILQKIILQQKDTINPHILCLLDFINREGHTSTLSKENYFTNHYILILYLGLTSENSELAHWTSRVVDFAKFLIFMLEYCQYFNFKKYIKILSDDLLLLFSINLKLYISTNSDYLRKSMTELFKILFHFADAMPKGYISEFMRKILTQNSKHSATLERIKNSVGAASQWDLQVILYTNSFVIKSLSRFNEDSLLLMRSDIDTKYKALVKLKKDIKVKNQKLAKKYSDILLDPKVQHLSTDQTQEENSIIQLEVERLINKRKWKKLQKCLKQWQGSWRDYELFLHPERLPLILSEHRFLNQCRCLMKIRYYRTEFLKPGDFPESYQSESKEMLFYRLLGAISVIQPHRDSKRSSPLLKASMKQNWSSEKIARALYQGITAQYLDALPQPLNCELFTPLVAKKGKIIILFARHSYIVFIFESNKIPINDERLMFSYNQYKRKKIIKRWKIRNIKAVYRKYIVETSSALEVQFYNGKNVLFNFSQEDERELFLVKLSKLYKDLKFGVLEKSNKISAATDEWVNWRISTFDYLMLLNNYSGRSYLNVSQYPVYPWIIEDLQLDESQGPKIQLRDLTKNVGMMGEKARAEEFKLRYSMDDMGDLGRFHFGSHFSNPGIVFQYLMRIFPFFEAYVKFFSGLDDPNRMFHSIEESMSSAKKDPSDVRELIPEFFTFPEMLLNREHFKLGIRDEDNEVVDDVRLPSWANRSPFTYISSMRQALESDEASQSISNWFDLLFGFKQRGKEAEKAYNLYPLISYDAGKILAKTNKDVKEGYKMQAYHWGQSPLQLLTKKHASRAIKFSERVYSLCDINCKPNLDIKEEELKPLSFYQRIIKIITFEESKKMTYFTTISLDGKIQDVSVEYSESADGVTPILTKLSPREYPTNYFSNGWCHLDPQIAVSTSFPIVYAKKKGIEMIAQGGYLNGSIQITILSKNSSITRLSSHRATCNCLEIDKDCRLAISGSITGEIIIYYVEENLMWVPYNYLRHQGGRLNYLHLSDEMQLFCTSNEDSSVCVYTKSESPKLLRVLHHPHFLSVDYALLAQNPLPCIVMFSRTDSMFNVFSLSGDFLYNSSDTTRDIISPVIGRDSNFCNYLIYIKDNDNMFTVRKLPTLERKMLATKKKATCISIFPSQKLAIVGRVDGRIDMVWDKKTQIAFSSKLPLTF